MASTSVSLLYQLSPCLRLWLLPQLAGRRIDILRIHQLLSSLSGIRHLSVDSVIGQVEWRLLGRSPFRASLAIQM